MKIDIPTLFIVMMMNGTLIGIIFLAAWFRARSPIQLRVGVGALVLALGILLLLLRGKIPDRISIDIANAVAILGVGLAWSGVRVFEGRAAPPWVILAGPLLWLAACTVPAFHDQIAHRLALSSLIIAAYTLDSAYQFSRARSEHLGARRPIAVLLFIHSLFLLARAGNALFGTPPSAPFEGNWLQSTLLAEPVLMLMALSLLGIILVRERSESVLRRTAETDDLTGVLNRGALLARARHCVAESRRAGKPVAVLLFDLDHFKSINDRFGHSVGDQTLRTFALVVTQAIRQSDLFGRVGGEEFVALLPGADEWTASLIAERIRLDFARTALALDGPPATVSAGVAAARASEIDLEALLAQADRALYAAKGAGRDRVIGSPALAS